MRKILFVGFALLVAHGRAGADAHHQLLGHSPIHDKSGAVIGFKAQVLVDPQRTTSNHATHGGDVRLGLGGLRYDRSKAVTTNANHHRDAVAGVSPGYVLHQFKMREITGPNPTDRGPLVETLQSGGAAKEVEVEVHYKDNPNLIPGSHVDLVAGFWKGSYWHVWGAADSPTTSTRDYVIKLPGHPSPQFIQQQLASLAPLHTKAEADAKAAQHQFDVASQARATALAAYNTANTQRYAPQQALQQTLQQANQAAHQTFVQATQGPQNAYNTAMSAARATLQSATNAAQTTYHAAVQSAQAALQAAGNSPQAQQVYHQATQAAHAALTAANQQANAAYQQASVQAQTTLNAVTNVARNTYNQAVQANQATYQTQLNQVQASYSNAWQQYSAANTAFSQAQTAKMNADATLKDLADKIANFKQMQSSLASQSSQQASQSAATSTP